MVRFLADASLRYAIVTGCARREPAIDFLSARAAKSPLASIIEDLVLVWTASELEDWTNRILEIPLQ